MPIRFYCEKCHFRLRTPDGSAGMTVNCSRCTHKQIVPKVTDPEAERASQNRRAFLFEVRSSQVTPISAEDRAAYEEPPIEMIVDDQEDVFVAEIADDEHENQEEDPNESSAMSELGRALVPQEDQQPIPDFQAAFAKPKPLPQQDGAQALAGLAQQVQSTPKSGTRPIAKTTAKPGAAKPAPAKKPLPGPKKVLRPAPAASAGAASYARKRVPGAVVWACRVAGAAGIPCAVKIALITRDTTGDTTAGLCAGITIGIVAIIAFALGEIADSL